MQRLKELFFGRSSSGDHNGHPDVRAAIEAWRLQSGIEGDQSHYLSRYVVVDVLASGLDTNHDRLLGIGGVALGKDAVLMPDDAFALDIPATDDLDADTIDRQLAAFLMFAGRGVLVTYHEPFVGAFLTRYFNERLGFPFQPEWIDLAWLLPDLFKERADRFIPMDAWLDIFGIQVPGRRDPLANAVAIARLLQIALPRATQLGANTPAKLLDIGRARRWLQRTG